MEDPTPSRRSLELAAGKGVSKVVLQCEDAKESGILDLSDCYIRFIPDAVYFLLREYQIDSLIVKGNNLKKFPIKVITKLPNIKEINLENNLIETIPGEIINLTALTSLNMRNNKLTALPDNLLTLPQLKYLDIRENLIQGVDLEKILSSSTVSELFYDGKPADV